MSEQAKNLGRPRLQQQDIPTKEKILLTATKLFVEEGYKGASMDEVALRCNVTKATVYYYYKTKADLFTAAIDTLMMRIRTSSVKILSSELPFRERLVQLIIAFSYATVDIDVNNFIREAAPSLSAEQYDKITNTEDDMHAAIEQCFILAVEEGTLPQKNTKYMTHLFLSLLNLSKYKDKNGDSFFPTVEENACHLVDFYWNGLQIENN
ncbi:TetR/AcrR family transcriptional regulator [Kurthia sibirica]|uniref:TetR family transcriptional regulator n=1 Tax=Kurthia sibirica TaxID=202750 RepID=A0A2U3APU8_9BACL|nr:TetR/AcrR family transcriptional regulator [Kurthia sibirica]PWI26557.1 TetR family transcriptional regulator [Kurthia sibirica]GEK32807.1 TetR family transcriptional regulator [Kurthia sibirica]